jgi:hypothetical protein
MGSTPQGPYGKPPSGQPAPMQEGDFTPAARNHLVSVGECEVDPPIWLYVTVEDIFVLAAFSIASNTNVQANIRLLKPKGGVEQIILSIPATNAGGVTSTSQQAREGYLLSAELLSNTAGALNYPCFAWLALNRGGTAANLGHRLITAGYLNNNFGPSYPERAPMRPTDGAGTVTVQLVGNPAAGSDWSFAIPGNSRFQLTAVHAKLVTSSTAGTRTASLQFKDGSGNVLGIIDATATQALSTTIDYTGITGAFAGGGGGVHNYWPLPPITLGQSFTIGTTTANLAAGDQWSAITLTGLTWVDYL